jgi:hypothetical protein
MRARRPNKAADLHTPADAEAQPATTRSPVDPRRILHLQRSAGNAAAAGLLGQHRDLPVQRQPVAAPIVPLDLRNTPHYRGMADADLQQRHDRILAVLARFTQSTPETAILEQQVAQIGVELMRRNALAAGRTFSDEDIARTKQYFVDNATSTQPDSCIVALNKGLRLATADPKLPTTPQSVEKTMEKVETSGHSGPAHEIAFRTSNGRITRGGARPATLDESIAEAIGSMSGGDPGWSVFTMSLLDGYHSVTLTVDAADPSRRRIFWSDQWSSKGGWLEYDPVALDAEATRLVQGWWDGQAEGKKHVTVVRLWRVTAKPQPAAP